MELQFVFSFISSSKKLSPASNELDFVVCEFVLHGAQQLASLSDEDVEIFIFGWLFELPLSCFGLAIDVTAAGRAH